MSITKKLEKDVNQKREEFISKGGSVHSDKKTKGDFTNICIRIPTQMLNNIDIHNHLTPWLTRTQWIAEAIDHKLNHR